MNHKARRHTVAMIGIAASAVTSVAIGGGDYGRAKDPTLAVDETLALAKVMTQRRAKVDSTGTLVPSQSGEGLQAYDTILRGTRGAAQNGACAINLTPVTNTKGLGSTRPVTVIRGTTVVRC